MVESAAERREALEKALRYSKKATRTEQLLIRSRSDRLSGDLAGAIEKLKELIREDPAETLPYIELAHLYYWDLRDYRSAANVRRRLVDIDPSASYVLLAYSYSKIGVVDSAFWAIDRHVAQNPEDPNAYDTRADLLLGQGMVDRAIESYNQALAVDPDFVLSRLKLGHLWLRKRDYAAARTHFQVLTKSPSPQGRGRGRLGLAFIPVSQGKLQEALEVLDAGISADRMERYTGRGFAYKLISKAIIHMERGEEEQAVQQINALADECPDPFWRHIDLHVFSKCSDLSSAEQALLSLRSAIVDTTVANAMYPYWIGKAWMDISKGNYDEACRNIERIEPHWFIYSDYPLGLAHLKGGRLADAIRLFEFICRRNFSTGDSADYPALWIPKSHYYLAVAYQESGWRDKAIAQFEDFLDMWKDADPGLEIVEDARQRLDALRAGS
jgi:tetratricopeptide (TPR) repeat protein